LSKPDISRLYPLRPGGCRRNCEGVASRRSPGAGVDHLAAQRPDVSPVAAVVGAISGRVGGRAPGAMRTRPGPRGQARGAPSVTADLRRRGAPTRGPSGPMASDRAWRACLGCRQRNGCCRAVGCGVECELAQHELIRGRAARANVDVVAVHELPGAVGLT
jgi:hypothetical protein